MKTPNRSGPDIGEISDYIFNLFQKKKMYVYSDINAINISTEEEAIPSAF